MSEDIPSTRLVLSSEHVNGEEVFVSISEIVNDVELPKISDESFAIDSGMKRKRGRPLGPSQMDTSLIINNNRLQPNNNLPQLQKRKSQGVAPKEKEGTQS